MRQLFAWETKIFKPSDNLSDVVIKTLASPQTWGLFETMRVIQGCIPLLVFHFQRLENSLNKLGIKNATAFTASAKVIVQTVVEKDRRDFFNELWRLRISLIFPEGTEPPLLLLSADPYKPPDAPVRLMLDSEKGLRFSCDSTVSFKLTNRFFLENYRKSAVQKGFHDAVIINEKKEICETTRYNIFFVKGKNHFITPSVSSGLLPGVMRGTIIQELRKRNIRVQEKPVRLRDLAQYPGCFITNALAGALSVSEIWPYAKFSETLLPPCINQVMSECFTGQTLHLPQH